MTPMREHLRVLTLSAVWICFKMFNFTCDELLDHEMMGYTLYADEVNLSH